MPRCAEHAAGYGVGTLIDMGITTRERVPAPLCSVPVPLLSTGFCALLPKSHPFATWREVPVTVLHSERLVTLAGLPLPESVTVRAADDAAPHTGVFAVMPGLDSLKQAVANGLGIGIVPRAAVSSLALAGLVAIPLLAAPAGSGTRSSAAQRAATSAIEAGVADRGFRRAARRSAARRAVRLERGRAEPDGGRRGWHSRLHG